MTAIESSAEGTWLPGWFAAIALDWRDEEAAKTLVLRDTDDTEDSDEEEDEAAEEDAGEQEPDSDVLWTAEPNAVHGHGKPSREEIEEELEEMQDEGGTSSDEEEAEEKDRGDVQVDAAIDSALRMSAR